MPIPDKAKLQHFIQTFLTTLYILFRMTDRIVFGWILGDAGKDVYKRQIQRNTEMAMKALDAVTDKIYDDRLAAVVAEQELQYSRLHDLSLIHI